MYPSLVNRSQPCSINLVHTPTHKRALGTKEEGDDAGALVWFTLALEGRGLVELGVIGAAVKIPRLLHQWRVDGTWSNGIDAYFSLTVLLGCCSC